MTAEASLMSRWTTLCKGLGIRGTEALRQGESLLESYAEPHRRYHDLAHLSECFEMLDDLDGLSDHDRAVVELAIWFHDVVYDPTTSDNEANSADIARRWLGDRGLVSAEQVATLVLSTAGHEQGTESVAEGTLLDIDLAILGSASERYDDYSNQIRLEYGHLSDEQFKIGRHAVLESFLERDAIYVRPDVRARLEQQARHNLARELRSLNVRHSSRW